MIKEANESINYFEAKIGLVMTNNFYDNFLKL